jgi:hypothetical protein
MSNNNPVKHFFHWSELTDHAVLRPLSHVRPNWELDWDDQKKQYSPEEDSFAHDLNEVIDQLATLQPPLRYHDNEDRLAEFVRARLNWKIEKVGNRWVGEDYAFIIEQGSFGDYQMPNLLLAACGRIHAAISRGQLHFDDMEDSHQHMLAAVLSTILYHRDYRS